MKINKIHNKLNTPCKEYKKYSLEFISKNTRYKHNSNTEYKSSKQAIKEKLKNANILYCMYSGIDVGIPSKILNDKKFMTQLYNDTAFMKASVKALLAITEEKLQDNSLDTKDKNELKIMYTLFLTQLAMFDDSKDVFITNSKQWLTAKLQTKQPAFCSIFNYGIFNKPKTRRQKAEAIVNRHASKAAAESAILLQISTAIETVALTENTYKMCRRICETYEMPGTAITALLAQLSGAMAGKTAASWATKWFPGAGNAANATITYALHQIQGRAIISWCEANYKNSNITDWDTLARGINLFRFANKTIGNPVDNYINTFGSEDGLSDFINNSK